MQNLTYKRWGWKSLILRTLHIGIVSSGNNCSKVSSGFKHFTTFADPFHQYVFVVGGGNINNSFQD